MFFKKLLIYVLLFIILKSKGLSLTNDEKSLTINLAKSLIVKRCIFINEEEKSIQTTKDFSLNKIFTSHMSEMQLHKYVEQNPSVDVRTMIIYRDITNENLTKFLLQLKLVNIYSLWTKIRHQNAILIKILIFFSGKSYT